MQQFSAAKHNTAQYNGVTWMKANKAAYDGRFSRTGFAQQAQRFAFIQIKANAVNRPNFQAPESNLEVSNFEKFLHQSSGP